jgi:DnaJ-class molecular chaperone
MASSSTYTSGATNQKYPCPQCGGSGTIPHRNATRTCPLCHGSAYVDYKTQQKFLNAQPLSTVPDKTVFVNCPECGGSKEIQDPDTGKLIDCTVCNASGIVTEAEKKKWLEDNGGI